MQPSESVTFDPLLGTAEGERPENRELAFTIVDEYVRFPKPRPEEPRPEIARPEEA